VPTKRILPPDLSLMEGGGNGDGRLFPLHWNV